MDATNNIFQDLQHDPKIKALLEQISAKGEAVDFTTIINDAVHRASEKHGIGPVTEAIVLEVVGILSKKLASLGADHPASHCFLKLVAGVFEHLFRKKAAEAGQQEQFVKGSDYYQPKEGQ